VSWDSEADVVIAGAGGAGLEAAIEAAAAGANTLLFEKQARLWESSTAIAVGRTSFPGTDLQKKNGIEDSKELMFRDVMETGRQKNDPTLVQAYVDHALDTFRQLCELGIQWSPTVTAIAGMTVPRGHLTDMMDLVRTLKREAEARGAAVLFQAPVTGLITGEDGAVAGVMVRERSGCTSRVRARCGVVLASGGFARDPRRLRSIEPRFEKVVATSGAGHTGDALRWSEALGADTRDIEYVQPSFELHASGGTSDDILLLYYQGGIIVNAAGDRFVDESISYKDIARACLDQPGMMGYQIFDSAVYDKAVAAQKAAGQSSPMTLDVNKIRLLVKGETLDALGAKLGMPDGRLAATVARYNGFIEAGKDDDFGRATLAGNYGAPQKIERGPFYAYATIGHLLATYGGIAVDAQMRVLRKGKPIPGLYAAGEATGGFHGASYHSGTGIGKALIFGRIAGRNAAQRKTV
jgi:fumarate reductase flavoprotein subunit